MKKTYQKILSWLLFVCMLITAFPLGAVTDTIAETNERLAAALDESDSYVHSLAIDNNAITLLRLHGKQSSHGITKNVNQATKHIFMTGVTTTALFLRVLITFMT